MNTNKVPMSILTTNLAGALESRRTFDLSMFILRIRCSDKSDDD